MRAYRAEFRIRWGRQEGIHLVFNRPPGKNGESGPTASEEFCLIWAFYCVQAFFSESRVRGAADHPVMAVSAALTAAWPWVFGW